MGELLDRALSPDVINQAWRRLARDKAVWVPGLPRSAMEPDRMRHVLELVEDLRSGAYRPQPMRQFTIAKASGGRRVLSTLCLRDKLAQRMLLCVLEPIGEALFHHDSFGYRPARNVDMAVVRARERIACGLHWLVDADIRSFFDRIPHRPLRKLLRQHIPDRDVLRLFDQWLALNTSHAGPFAGRRGISQGAIVSPLLCNLYLHSLDTALADHDIPFVRYADDFLLFAGDEKAATAARDLAARHLDGLGLELHPDKTRIVPSGPNVTFLGKRLPKPPAVTQAVPKRRPLGLRRRPR